MSAIVGKKFIISTKDPRTDQYRVRQVLIVREFTQDGERMYEVKGRGRKPFSALADVYDRYFNLQKGNIKPKGYKGASIGGPGVRISEY